MFSVHDEDQVVALLESHGHKKFRYAQIENAIYKNNIDDFDLIETLPREIRDLLKTHCFYTSLSLHSAVTSDS